MSENRKRLQSGWARSIPLAEWRIYRAALNALRQANVRFLLGGGFAFAAFTGRWRNTKDIDFYIHPQEHKRAIAALEGVGFTDYFSTQPYDRGWSYRGVRGDCIVDLLWGMANYRADVDDTWFVGAPLLVIRREKLLVIPPEELIWCKIYIVQRTRCDWPDLLNVIYVRGRELDWPHLLRRLEDDAPLLSALLTVYGWLCPRSARQLPGSLLKRLGIAPAFDSRPRAKAPRGPLLDTSRRWFVAEQPRGRQLDR